MHLMTDDESLDGLTLADIRRLRKALFEKLFSEPITDPGFKRPYEKLHLVVKQSEKFIERLRTTVRRGDPLQATLSKAREGINVADGFVQWVEGIALHFESLEDDLQDILGAINLPDAEREQHDARRDYEMQVQRMSIPLLVLLRQLPSQATRLAVSTGLAQLVAAQLWAFLEQVTTCVATGTKEVFHKQGLPSGMHDLFSDAVDKSFEMAETVKFTPVLSVIRAIYSFIRRKDLYDQHQAETWTKFEMNIFLSAYFQWWTEGSGMEAIEELVQDSEKRLDERQREVDEFLSLVRQAAMQMENFKLAAEAIE
jgi:hypothetical protein